MVEIEDISKVARKAWKHGLDKNEAFGLLAVVWTKRIERMDQFFDSLPKERPRKKTKRSKEQKVKPKSHESMIMLMEVRFLRVVSCLVSFFVFLKLEGFEDQLRTISVKKNPKLWADKILGMMELFQNRASLKAIMSKMIKRLSNLDNEGLLESLYDADKVSMEELHSSLSKKLKNKLTSKNLTFTYKDYVKTNHQNGLLDEHYKLYTDLKLAPFISHV